MYIHFPGATRQLPRRCAPTSQALRATINGVEATPSVSSLREQKKKKISQRV
jgi:hypothetical protein